MSRRTFLSILKYAALLALMAAFGWNDATAWADDRTADFGKQWVRNNPFTIMGAVHLSSDMSFDIDQYLDMNLNTVFANNTRRVAEVAADAGVAWQGSGYMTGVTRPEPLFTDANKAVFNELIARGHATAWHIDEPSAEGLANVGANIQWMKDTHPELLAYVTEGGGHSIGFLQSVMDTIQPDLLMFDNYPFRVGGDDNDWFLFAMDFRQVALANQVPYGGWLQSFRVEGTTLRTLSESDTRYNGFTMLTAGYTMLNYFVYVDTLGASVKSTLLDQNGNPTALYHQAAAANREYANVGQSLRFLTSTDVRFVPGRRVVFGPFTASNSTPLGLSNWVSGSGGDPHIQSVTVDVAKPGHLGSEKNGLIGFFTDDDGEQYFMLTNLNHGGNLSAADAALSFVVTFDSSVDSIWLLNRLTGEIEEILLSDHVLSWTLPGGTGDLFKYDNGNFAGVVPEPATLTLLGLGVLTVLRRRR